MKNPLPDVYGSILVVRPPVPATCNKAGANYKSEVTHEIYAPRQAYDEWLAICEGIAACGGDALFEFEAADEAYLDRGDLEVSADGSIRPAGSSEVLGSMDQVMTGRVFAANGPWVVVDGNTMRAVMPHMLAHRRNEAPYYRELLGRVAELGGYTLEMVDDPERWEGMADVAVVDDRVVLTYAVAGHYDEATEPKTPRSCREGIRFAADVAGVPEEARIFVELVYPHFHGDTVHFGVRPADGESMLCHYPGGLWGDGAKTVAQALGRERIIAIGADDAVKAYAGNSRQVNDGVLVPGGVSAEFERSLAEHGLSVHRIDLHELFGKAGGGPACATLYLPRNLELPEDAPMRYSVRRAEAHARRERIPERLLVDPEFFRGKKRG